MTRREKERCRMSGNQNRKFLGRRRELIKGLFRKVRDFRNREREIEKGGTQKRQWSKFKPNRYPRFIINLKLSPNP